MPYKVLFEQDLKDQFRNLEDGLNGMERDGWSLLHIVPGSPQISDAEGSFCAGKLERYIFWQPGRGEQKLNPLDTSALDAIAEGRDPH